MSVYFIFYRKKTFNFWKKKKKSFSCHTHYKFNKIINSTIFLINIQHAIVLKNDKNISPYILFIRCEIELKSNVYKCRMRYSRIALIRPFIRRKHAECKTLKVLRKQGIYFKSYGNRLILICKLTLFTSKLKFPNLYTIKT